MFDWVSLLYQNNLIIQCHDTLCAPSSDMGQILFLEIISVYRAVQQSKKVICTILYAVSILNSSQVS